MKLVWLLCLNILPVQCGLEIIDAIIEFKDQLLGGLFSAEGGGGNCGCPCREYYVSSCDTEYIEECYQEHYQTKCLKKAVQVPKQGKEIECQKCRKFHVTVFQQKWFKECYPVFDEKCSTTYHKHCKVHEKCTEIYQTVCQNLQYGYQQKCEQVPSQSCYPETVCHNTPQTSCHPVRLEKCEKVKKDVPVEQPQFECLPFQHQNSHVDNTAQCSGGYSSGYGAAEEGTRPQSYIYPAIEANGYTGPDTDGYNVPPSDGYNVPPSNGYNVPPSNGYNVPPSNGYNVPPSDAYNVLPSDGYNAPPSAGYNVPPPAGYNVPVQGSPLHQADDIEGHSPYGGDSIGHIRRKKADTYRSRIDELLAELFQPEKGRGRNQDNEKPVHTQRF